VNCNVEGEPVAEARATVCFDTRLGQQVQINFGEPPRGAAHLLAMRESG
jgi:hypothetical protein